MARKSFVIILRKFIVRKFKKFYFLKYFVQVKRRKEFSLEKMTFENLWKKDKNNIVHNGKEKFCFNLKKFIVKKFYLF